MYVSNVSAQTVNLRYSYSNQQSDKTKDGQDTAGKENLQTTEAKSQEKSTNFSDVLSIMSENQSPVQDIEAYVMETVSEVLEKIAEHSANTMSSQAGRFSVSYTSINITIEMSEGETLEDVKSELDQMLSDDGYWGVEQTSQRMFDFAKAFTGGNPEDMAKAKDAVTEGFKQAEALFGGQLPEISYKTYDATMEKFDNYLANISNSVEASLA